MLNKKGGVPAEQMIAIAVVIILLTISALIFTACVAQKEKQSYIKWDFTKDEIEAMNTLNHFLRIPIDKDRTVMDLIVESYLNDDYTELHAIVFPYFESITNNWIFVVDYGGVHYRIDGTADSSMQTVIIPTAIAPIDLVVPLVTGGFETIEVSLEIGPKITS